MIKYRWFYKKCYFERKEDTIKPNYELKKKVLENNCCKLRKKISLCAWKISQYQTQQYELNEYGIVPDNEIKDIDYWLDKQAEYYIKYKESGFTSEEGKEADKVNNAEYKRTKRLQTKALEMIKSNSAIFLSLTFNDSVFEKMNSQTRKRMITRFLKKTCKCYIANIDYGKKKEREHYHALVIPLNEKIDCKEYHKMFYNSNIDFEKVRVSGKKNCDIESTSKKISKYTSKLTNHAIKETTQQCRIIYSKS